MKYDYTNGIDTRRLLSVQHNTHYRFFPMKITRSPFSLVPFLFKFCLKIPDCDQYKSRRRLSGNGCYIANTTLANFCTFSNK